MNILYFASLKEELKVANEVIELDAGSNMSVADLKSLLAEKYGEQHFSNILCAVNHTIAQDSDALKNHDEVAFYPPVTGG
ncbi:MAG: molybdopterin converting factor subunit 1 [Candidatus Thioglobus sp.]|nr:MAG: molybdopterin converting factor subunit 1 [Candidatus Thioglobus sp.]